MFIDSHAHLTASQLLKDVDAILQRAQTVGVNAIINICTNADTLREGIALANRYSWVYNAAATTPHEVEKEGKELFPAMAVAARNGQLIAIGETGLDYYYKYSKPDIQKQFFRKYLQLAAECQLPVIVHCREAFGDFFEIVDSEHIVNGVLHCFTGSLAEAEKLLSRGWYLSFSGIITFKRSDELRCVAKIVPSDRILIETDAPYLAPQSVRGQRNEPSYLPEIAQVMADIRGVSLEEIAQISSANAQRLFAL